MHTNYLLIYIMPTNNNRAPYCVCTEMSIKLFRIISKMYIDYLGVSLSTGSLRVKAAVTRFKI